MGLSILLILCAGDGTHLFQAAVVLNQSDCDGARVLGFADLFGRKYGGSARLPHNRAKSWAGSIAFFAMSLGFQCAFTHLFHARGWFDVSLQQYLPTILKVTLVATAVESLPVDDWDNVTVSLSAWAVHLMLGA